ncbi:MAG: zinc-binding alcohol dehydrogenase [Alphaproteobacteria bacterium]|nr:zinc-binding alcohol dehydrogenase [Alphaproteobacteria bacterium]
MTATASLWITALRQASLLHTVLPPLPPGCLRIAATASGISRGTEGLVFNGLIPDSERRRMRAPFQEGDFPWPVKYGYCAVGRVIAGDPARLGERVFALHPHQSVFDVPADAAFAIGDDVPDDRATLAANLETAINALWDAPPRVGDRVVVAGAGTVGLLVAWLVARVPGVHAIVIEPDPGRAATAREFGLTVAAPDRAPGDADLVFHASGRPEGLVRALELAGDEATVVELSWYGARPVPLPLGGAFHARRLRLVSSQVGQLPTERRPRWSHRRRLGLALDLLRDPVLDRLIGERVALADAVASLPRIFDTPTARPWTVIVYPHAESEP